MAELNRENISDAEFKSVRGSVDGEIPGGLKISPRSVQEQSIVNEIVESALPVDEVEQKYQGLIKQYTKLEEQYKKIDQVRRKNPCALAGNNELKQEMDKLGQLFEPPSSNSGRDKIDDMSSQFSSDGTNLSPSSSLMSTNDEDMKNCLEKLRNEYDSYEPDVFKIKPIANPCQKIDNLNDLHDSSIDNQVECLNKKFQYLTSNIKKLKNDFSCIEKCEVNSVKEPTKMENNCVKEIPAPCSEEKEKEECHIENIAPPIICPPVEVKEIPCEIPKVTEEKPICTKPVLPKDYECMKKQIEQLEVYQRQYQCLVSEQSDQLCNYRTKYLCAQQTVEEQRCKLKAFEECSSKLEAQIRQEVHRMRQKLETKAKKFQSMAQLLADENQKLCHALEATKHFEEQIQQLNCENQDLQTQLRKLKKKYQAIAGDGNHLKLIKKENDNLKSRLQRAEDEKAIALKKLEELKAEFAQYRQNAKTSIAHELERAKIAKIVLEQQIDKLESELTQARASGSIVVNNQEEYMREMQNQLKILTKNFQDAQTQVNQLKSYVGTGKDGENGPETN